MKLTLEQQYLLSVLHSQYHACWCSGDFRSQCISRHGIAPQMPQYSISSIRRVNIVSGMASTSITRANVDSYLWHDLSSPGISELTLCDVDFIFGKIKVYLHFVSFLITGMEQILVILSSEKKHKQKNINKNKHEHVYLHSQYHDCWYPVSQGARASAAMVFTYSPTFRTKRVLLYRGHCDTYIIHEAKMIWYLILFCNQDYLTHVMLNLILKNTKIYLHFQSFINTGSCVLWRSI